MNLRRTSKYQKQIIHVMNLLYVELKKISYISHTIILFTQKTIRQIRKCFQHLILYFSFYLLCFFFFDLIIFINMFRCHSNIIFAKHMFVQCTFSNLFQYNIISLINNLIRILYIINEKFVMRWYFEARITPSMILCYRYLR